MVKKDKKITQTAKAKTKDEKQILPPFTLI